MYARGSSDTIMSSLSAFTVFSPRAKKPKKRRRWRILIFLLLNMKDTIAITIAIKMIILALEKGVNGCNSSIRLRRVLEL